MITKVEICDDCGEGFNLHYYGNEDNYSNKAHVSYPWKQDGGLKLRITKNGYGTRWVNICNKCYNEIFNKTVLEIKMGTRHGEPVSETECLNRNEI